MFKKIIFLLLFSNVINASDFLIVQSTTSTQDSGLYDYLLPVYEKKTGNINQTIDYILNRNK